MRAVKAVIKQVNRLHNQVKRERERDSNFGRERR